MLAAMTGATTLARLARPHGRAAASPPSTGGRRWTRPMPAPSPTLARSRSHPIPPAARSGGGGWGEPDEDDLRDAEFDGDGYFGGVDPSSLLSRAGALLSRLLDALSDAAAAAAPASMSRSTVDAGVRIGVGLVLLSAVKAAVGLVVTAGVAALGLAAAARLLSSEEGGTGARQRRGRGRGRGGGGGGDDDFWGGIRRSAGRGLPSGRAAGPAGGEGAQPGDGLLDVWFEPRRAQLRDAEPARRLPPGGPRVQQGEGARVRRAPPPPPTAPSQPRGERPPPR